MQVGPRLNNLTEVVWCHFSSGKNMMDVSWPIVLIGGWNWRKIPTTIGCADPVWSVNIQSDESSDDKRQFKFRMGLRRTRLKEKYVKGTNVARSRHTAAHHLLKIL